MLGQSDESGEVGDRANLSMCIMRGGETHFDARYSLCLVAAILPGLDALQWM